VEKEMKKMVSENDYFEERDKCLVNYTSHYSLAQKIAENSIILLKNDKNILPLSQPDFPKIYSEFEEEKWDLEEKEEIKKSEKKNDEKKGSGKKDNEKEENDKKNDEKKENDKKNDDDYSNNNKNQASTSYILANSFLKTDPDVMHSKSERNNSLNDNLIPKQLSTLIVVGNTANKIRYQGGGSGGVYVRMEDAMYDLDLFILFLIDIV
jgi:beta-glucosidase-like glycosyl hydrolase